MVRTHLFFKVEVEHDEDERPEKIGEEIGRQLRKLSWCGRWSCRAW
jgi:hypothetical protein